MPDSTLDFDTALQLLNLPRLVGVDEEGVDVQAFYHRRSDALLAHATQVDPESKFWFGLPQDRAAAAYPYDDYILAHDRTGVTTPESDVFAGVPGWAGL